MQRRALLQSLTASSLGLALRPTSAQMHMEHAPAAPSVPLLAPDLLPQGAVLQDVPRLANSSQRPGHFRGVLRAAPVDVPLVPGYGATTFWAYNGTLPGPCIEVWEGDWVEITFINQLPQASTIHWHGLPVPPSQDGNPWDVVPPGGLRVYRFQLPQGCAGTYWYHPHPHHHTAEQAFRGLAGPLLVRSRHDVLRDIPERLLVVSDLKLDAHAAIAQSDANDRMNGREGQFALVNAQHKPQLPFHAQGQERWRILNACSARYLRLALPGSTFTLLGTDGGLLERAQTGLTEILLTPAQRVEVLVQAGDRRDRIALNALSYDRKKMGVPADDETHALLTVDFSGVQTSATPPLPGKLRHISDLGRVSAHKQVVFSENMSMAGGVHSMQFLVNGHEYDMQRVDLTSKANRVELWELVNESDMDHPFHLHGTQFQVIEREYEGQRTPAPYRAWVDTVNLRSGETLRIKTVQRHKGLRMFHCHILEHEEAGMMGTLRVL